MAPKDTPCDSDDTLFSLSIDLVCVANLEGYYVRVNPAWTELLGFSPEEMCAEPIMNFVHPDDRESTQQAIEDFFNGKEILSFKNRYRKKAGGYVWLQWKGTFDHKQKKVYGIARDITDAIRRDSYLEKLSEITQTGVWEIEIDTQEIYWSERVHQIHETDPQTYIPNMEEAINFYHPDSLPTLTEAVERQIQYGESYDLELKFITAKGNLRWVRASSRTEYKNNKPARLFGSFEDITEKVRNRENARLQEERIKLANKASGIGIWDCDLTTHELIWDERMFEIYERPPSEFKNQIEDWKQCLHPDDAEYAENHFKAAVKDGTEFTASFRICLPNGGIKYIAAIATIFQNQEGISTRALGVNWDITQDELIKQQLKEQTLVAERSSQAKSQFIANMSHELRTPLNSVIGFSARLLRKADNVDNRTRTSLEAINNNGQHLLALVNDILDLSKIDSRKLEFNIRETEISEITQHFIEEQRPAFEEKSLVLTPQIEPGITLMTDGVRFKQVLMNLLSNALKYTPEGQVVVSLKCRDNEIVLSVTDTGIGIKDENLKKLFERFEQFDENSKFHIGGGAGLGLAITMELVKQLGGDLSVESYFGKGSRFSAIFPIK